MRDTLQAFADYCDRNTLDRRPTVYSRFVDIYGDPRGEIGLPDPDDVNSSVFALLCPWAMIPTIGDAWLIVDQVDALSVSHLFVNFRGMFNSHWSVPYFMDDFGTLSFGEAVSASVDSEIGNALVAVKSERRNKRYWNMGHTIESLVPIVDELIQSPHFKA
jgi:hypothetical protein